MNDKKNEFFEKFSDKNISEQILNNPGFVKYIDYLSEATDININGNDITFYMPISTFDDSNGKGEKTAICNVSLVGDQLSITFSQGTLFKERPDRVELPNFNTEYVNYYFDKDGMAVSQATVYDYDRNLTQTNDENEIYRQINKNSPYYPKFNGYGNVTYNSPGHYSVSKYMRDKNNREFVDYTEYEYEGQKTIKEENRIYKIRSEYGKIEQTDLTPSQMNVPTLSFTEDKKWVDMNGNEVTDIINYLNENSKNCEFITNYGEEVTNNRTR